MKNRIRLFLSIAFVFSFISTGKTNADEQKIDIYVVKPITNKRILPETACIPGKVSDTLSIVAALGEYEPASFVVRAKEDIKGLSFETSDFKNDKGKFVPTASIDIKVVKCWYQDEGRGYQEDTPPITYNPVRHAHKKVLVPELLLNDDSLIKVDRERKHNYIKISDKGEVNYVIISSERKGEGLSGAYAIPTNDSPRLMPVDIKANTNKQFWVTVKVPSDASPGIYNSQIKLQTEKVFLGVLKLQLRILPFRLSEPYCISSMGYRIPKAEFYKDRVMEQHRREMEDMYAHGVTNPPVHYVVGGVDDLEDFLKIRNEVGMRNKLLFCKGFFFKIGNPRSPEKLQALKDKVKEVIEIARDYGIEGVYFYGIDEALGIKKKRGDRNAQDAIWRLTSQRPAWEAVHQAGGKIFVAGAQVNKFNDERKAGNFGFMGDIQDLMIAHGYPSKEEAARWHSKGHLIACYANPQGGIEQPETYRRNYGLLLWQNDYDGAGIYIYHEGWGDFCKPNHRKQANMVYPIVNGVIGTIQWEGYREGVDDVRYMNTLTKAVEQAEKCESKKIAKLVKDIKQYISELKKGDINETVEDLDVVRSQIVDFILELTNKETSD